MCRCSVSREEPPPPAPARERTGGAAPVSEPKARSRGRRLDPLGHTATSRVGWRLPDSVLVPGHRTARSSGRPVDARWRLPDSEPITFVWRGLKRHLTEGNASRSGNRHPTARTDCPTGPPAHRPTGPRHHRHHARRRLRHPSRRHSHAATFLTPARGGNSVRISSRKAHKSATSRRGQARVGRATRFFSLRGHPRAGREESV